MDQGINKVLISYKDVYKAFIFLWEAIENYSNWGQAHSWHKGWNGENENHWGKYGSRTSSAIGQRRFNGLEKVCMKDLNAKIEELSISDENIDVEDFVKFIVLYVRRIYCSKGADIMFVGRCFATLRIWKKWMSITGLGQLFSFSWNQLPRMVLTTPKVAAH